MREESEIGAAVREFRKAKGLTLNDLAQATGFSQGLPLQGGELPAALPPFPP